MRGAQYTATTVDRRQLLRMLGMGTAALGVGGLTACSGPGGQPSSAGSAPPQPEDTGTVGAGTDAAAGPFTFTAWALNEEAGRPVVESLLASWEEETGSAAETSSFPYDEYLDQIVLQARGGNLQGAAQLDIAWLSTLATLGGLRDLSDVATEGGYTEAALATGRYEDVQYGLPWTTGSIGLIGNRELLDQAGVASDPSTIDEFESALEALQGVDNDLIPYAFMTDAAQLRDAIMWMRTYGSPILADGEVTLGDEGSVAAIEWLRGLYDRGLIAPDVDRFDARALFSQGRVGFYDDAIVAKGILIADSPDRDLESKIVPVPRPTTSGGDPDSLSWGHLVVVVEGEQAEAATAWARHLTGDTATAIEYFEGVALPPTTEESLADEAIASDEYISAWTEQVTAFAQPNPFWPYPQYAQMETILGEQLQAALLGRTEVQQALDAAREEIQALII